MMDHTTASTPFRSATGALSDVLATKRAALTSEEILQGGSSVAIDHQGTRYILHATRSGKLLLTK